MAITPESLQERWQKNPHPGSFYPDEPNWSDLSIRSLEPMINATLKQTGMHSVRRGDLPTININGPKDQLRIYGVKTVDELPAEIRNDQPIDVNIAQYFEDVVSSHYFRSNKGLFDPEDELFYMGADQTLATPFIMAIRHRPIAWSVFWQHMWSAEIDCMLDLTPLYESLNENMASSLIPPQTARQELQSNLLPVVFAHRETLTSLDPERKKPLWVDDKLIYSHFATIVRHDRYPFTHDDQVLARESFARGISDLAQYEASYRKSLLELFFELKKKGINLTKQFAAKEV